MKRLVLFASSFVIALGFAALVYLFFSPHHTGLRSTLFSSDREARQIAAINSIEFEKAHLCAIFGNPDAQYKLARYFKTGETGPQDKNRAAYWMQRAAKQGHVDATLSLARFYFQGFGVEKDDRTGARLVEQAAKAGSSAAKGLMGILYMGGIGVTQDFAQARHWLTQSDDPDAIELAFKLQALNGAIEKLPPEEREKAAESNYAAARADIGNSFHQMLEQQEKK